MKKSIAMSSCLALALSLSAATLFVGCAKDKHDRTTGQYIDDKSLSYKVSSAVHGNSQYKLDGVEAKVYRGTVQLSGFVESEEQKAKAAEIAKNVEGVQNVENNITVKQDVRDTDTQP